MQKAQPSDIAEKQLLAGVFLDPVTGRMTVEAAPSVMPYLLFLEATQGWLTQAVQQEQSKVVKASGPLPKL